MSMMRNFDKEFVERTRDLLASDIQGKALEYDVTLLLNCLLAMLTLPLERTRHKKDSNDLLFKTKCTNFLKNNAIITKGVEKEDQFIMMDIRDAIAHLRIKVLPDPYGKIEEVILYNDYNKKNEFECSMKINSLRAFALFVTNEYLNCYF